MPAPSGVGCSDVKLSSKPCWFLIIIWANGRGSENSTSPRWNINRCLAAPINNTPMKYYTSTTEFNCGIDLHARQMYVCLMDQKGKKLVHTNIRNNDFNYFLKLVQPYRHSLTVCCECMFGWYWLADACQQAGLTF